MPLLELLEIKCNGSCSGKIRVRPFFRGSPMGDNRIEHNCPSGWEPIEGSYSALFSEEEDEDGFLTLNYQGVQYTCNNVIDASLADGKKKKCKFNLPGGCRIRIRYRVVANALQLTRFYVQDVVNLVFQYIEATIQFIVRLIRTTINYFRNLFIFIGIGTDQSPSRPDDFGSDDNINETGDNHDQDHELNDNHSDDVSEPEDVDSSEHPSSPPSDDDQPLR